MPIVSLHPTRARTPRFSPSTLVHRLALGASMMMLSAAAMSAVTVLSANREISASVDGTFFDENDTVATSGLFDEQVRSTRFLDLGASVIAEATQSSLLTNSRFEADGAAQMALVNPDGLPASAKSAFNVVFSVLTAQDFFATVSFNSTAGFGAQGLLGFVLEDENTGADIVSFAPSGDVTGSISQTFSGLLQAGNYRLLALSDFASSLTSDAVGSYRFSVDFSDAADGNAVPLPGSAALAALGLALLGAQRRRVATGAHRDSARAAAVP